MDMFPRLELSVANIALYELDWRRLSNLANDQAIDRAMDQGPHLSSLLLRTSSSFSRCSSSNTKRHQLLVEVSSERDYLHSLRLCVTPVLRICL